MPDIQQENVSSINKNIAEDKLQPLIKITTIVYALQAVPFGFCITHIVAVIINYIKKTMLKGHGWSLILHGK
jgi:uncharacterized membrane protein